MKRKVCSIISVFVLILILSLGAFGENLILNGDFEEFEGNMPNEWRVDAYLPDSTDLEIKIENIDSPSGNSYITINNLKENDSRIVQDFPIEPGSIYKITYNLKINNITKGSGGANLTLINGVYFGVAVSNTNKEWQKQEYYIKTHPDGDDFIELWLRFGGFGSTVEGSISYDNLQIEKIETVPDGKRLEECYIEVKNNDSDIYTNIKNDSIGDRKVNTSNNLKIFLYIFGSILIIAIIIFIEKVLMKKNAEEKIKVGDMDKDFDYTEND